MQYPEMRRELVACLRGLSDIDYQRRCWIQSDCPAGAPYDDFDQAIHLLYDDTALASDPSRLIGVILVNEIEAELIRELCRSLDALFDRWGLDRSDADYLNTPDWPDILLKARQAYEVISATTYEDRA